MSHDRGAEFAVTVTPFLKATPSLAGGEPDKETETENICKQASTNRLVNGLQSLAAQESEDGLQEEMSSSQTVWAGESNGVPIIGSSKASVELAWALAKGDLELVKKIQNEILMQAMGMLTPVEMEPSSSTSSEASQSAGEPVAEEIPEAHVLQFVSEAPINK